MVVPLSIQISPTSQKRVLVFGATGKQGGTVIQHLLERQRFQPLDIIAVTRSIASQSAQSFASKANVSVVGRNLDDPITILQQPSSVWGTFSAQFNSDTGKRSKGKRLSTPPKAMWLACRVSVR